MIFGTVRRTRCRDPGMPLTDVQWVMGHVHLSATQQYLNPLTEDVIAGVLAFHSRRREPGPGSPQPAAVCRPESLLALFAFALAHPLSQQSRRLGLVAVVNWLEAQPGASWQDRWLASGAEAMPDWRDLARTWREGRLGGRGGGLTHIGAGLLVLICADVIRPGAGWLLRCSPTPRNLAAEMARTRDAAAFAELAALCESGSVGTDARRVALDRIAIIMAAKGGGVTGITVGDCVDGARRKSPGVLGEIPHLVER